MRILISESGDYSAEAVRIYKTLGDVTLADANRKELQTLIRDADILVVRLRNQIDAELLSYARSLKAVVSPTTGLNHIETSVLDDMGVALLSLKGETAFLQDITATAELAWSLVLNLFRPVIQAHAHVLAGKWNRDPFKGRELKGKTLGIVGCGRLGRIVAQYGNAFRMKVLAADPYIAEAPEGVTLTSLDNLLALSDVVSLHVPLAPETESFFDAACFSAMKKVSYFINTSRGELVDERALLAALQRGDLAGAAVDVLRGETSQVQDWTDVHPLVQYARCSNNLIIVPHIGGATRDSMVATEVFMAQKLVAFMEDNPFGGN